MPVSIVGRTLNRNTVAYISPVITVTILLGSQRRCCLRIVGHLVSRHSCGALREACHRSCAQELPRTDLTTCLNMLCVDTAPTAICKQLFSGPRERRERFR